VDDPSTNNANVTYCNYNAFLQGAAQLPEEGANTTAVTNFNWQPGRLGNFYLPINSPLIDRGSVTADQVGLYHFTTQTNEVPEGDSTVDIGYHYAANDVDTIWVEDAVPAGATESSDAWSWVSGNPPPYSGLLALQSDINAGTTTHDFFGATNVLMVYTNDALLAYVYLDPANPPSGIYLAWLNSITDQYGQAYWGANVWPWGATNMGPVPQTGLWVRLEVPASQIGLEGVVLDSMLFEVYGGRATWDHLGKTNHSGDTNGDGIPDYLEDANGNGLVDSGEIGWNIVGDLGLNVIIDRPRNGSTLP